MYPRNAASPERIAVGAVVQISDGAVQTSGVSISVRGQGGVSGAGAGTTAYDNGIVEYTPTQGETDFTSFVVVAYKTGCIPVAQTIITSASATPGHAGLDWGKVINPTTVVGLSGTTVKTATDVETDTQDLQNQIGAAGAGLTAINLPDQTMNITGNITGNLSGSVGSVTGNVGGNVAGSVGSVTGAVGSVTGNVGGNVAGSVASVTAEVTANVAKINSVAITGDGSGTPFNV